MFSFREMMRERCIEAVDIIIIIIMTRAKHGVFSFREMRERSIELEMDIVIILSIISIIIIILTEASHGLITECVPPGRCGSCC